MSPQEAARKILEGKLVVFPTETVYGLGALSDNDEAVKKIFTVKGRPSHNPLILHIAENEQLEALVRRVSPAAQQLIDRFWPGPLTICFQKTDRVSDLVSAGLSTVCIRRPDHPIAHEFLSAVGKPVAAPSANISGKPSTTTYDDARAQLESKDVLFLEGGKTPLGLESTIVDCSGDKVKLLRPGSISRYELDQVLGNELEDHSAPADHISSPGQLLAHYAPAGKLIVLHGSRERRTAWIHEQIPHPSEWVLGTFADADDRPFFKCYFLSDSEEQIASYASQLYAFLNWCDREKAENILLELPETPDPLIESIVNRLEKASRGHIVKV